RAELGGLELRLVPRVGAPPAVAWEVLPAGVLPAEERRLLGPEAADPWAPSGSTRLLVRVLRAALGAGRTHLVLGHAGRLVLGADGGRRRLARPARAGAGPM